jgi:hypothetical protein
MTVDALATRTRRTCLRARQDKQWERMGGSEISVRPGNWAPSEPALPHARKSKKPVLEWPFRGGTDSSNLLSSSGESAANLRHTHTVNAAGERMR